MSVVTRSNGQRGSRPHSGIELHHAAAFWAGSDVLEVHRAVLRWAERIMAESRQRISQVPELWFLTRGGASQVRVQAARRVRGRDTAAGNP